MGEIKREPESIYTTWGQTETHAVLVISKLVVCASYVARTLHLGAEHTHRALQHVHPGPWTHEAQVWPHRERFGLQVHDIRVQEKEDGITSPLEFSSKGRHPLIEAEVTGSRNESLSAAQAGRRALGALRVKGSKTFRNTSSPQIWSLFPIEKRRGREEGQGRRVASRCERAQPASSLVPDNSMAVTHAKPSTLTQNSNGCPRAAGENGSRTKR